MDICWDSKAYVAKYEESTNGFFVCCMNVLKILLKSKWKRFKKIIIENKNWVLVCSFEFCIKDTYFGYFIVSLDIEPFSH